MTIETIVAPNPGPFTLDGSRTYVLNGEIVIDPGPNIDAHVQAILVAAPRPQAIFVTHRHADHAPAAAPLKRKTGAAVIAPPGVLDEVADHRLTEGAQWHFGSVRLEALATPGHTPEHFCFLTADGDLFSGDTILGEGTTAIAPPEGDMRAYMNSLRKLRDRDPRRIFPGHGPIRDDATAWIDYYIGHRLARDQQILTLLREQPRSVFDLRAAIYPELNPALHRAAELQIIAHLQDLVSRAKVSASGERYEIRE